MTGDLVPFGGQRKRRKKIVEPLITERELAARFVAAFSDQWRYVAAWDEWLTWNGQYWARDNSRLVLYMMAMTAKEWCQSEEKFGEESRSLRTLGRYASLNGALKLASAYPQIAASPMDFDQHPETLNCRNGTVDLITGATKDHDPADMLTVMAPADYDNWASAPRWRRFLEEILPDEEARTHLHRLIGAAILGRGPREQVLPFLCGTGANGKSVFLSAILRALGEYARAMPGSLLTAQQDQHPTAIADLRGRRLAVVFELPSRCAWNEERLKSLSSEDTLTARRMHENFWAFTPTHMLFVVANSRPTARDSSDGFWRRMRLVDFGVSFLGREDKTLGAALTEEVHGILRWCVDGAREYQDHGLAAPASVVASTREYRVEEDSVARWLATLDPPCGSYEQYKVWAEATGEHVLRGRNFAAELRRLGWEQVRTKYARTWQPKAVTAVVLGVTQKQRDLPLVTPSDTSDCDLGYMRAHTRIEGYTDLGVTGVTSVTGREPGDDDE